MGSAHASAPVTGTFTGTGQSAAFGAPRGMFNVQINFNSGVGTVTLEKSFDAGSTWQTLSKNSNGDDASYAVNFNGTLNEPEQEVQYRFNCTAFTSGTITYRMSR